MPGPIRLQFDFVDAQGHPAPLAFERPERIIEAWRVEDVPLAWPQAEAARTAGRFVAGFVSYEASSGDSPSTIWAAPRVCG